MRSRLFAPWGLVAGLGLLAGCPDDEEEWARFNAPDDTLQVQVVAADEIGAAVSTELLSTTRARVVGEATIDPGSGPVGTDHEVTVLVASEHVGRVRRVTVEADAGDRGTVQAELFQDSADPALWWRVFTSLGAEGESRTDTFTFGLWSRPGDELPNGDGGGNGGDEANEDLEPAWLPR